MNFLISYIQFNNSLSINKLHLLDKKLKLLLCDNADIIKDENFPNLQLKLIDEKLWNISFNKIGLKFIDRIINYDTLNIEIEELKTQLVINSLTCKSIDLKFEYDRLYEYEIENYIPFHSISYLTFSNLPQEPQKEYINKFLKRHLHHFFRFIGFSREEINAKANIQITDYEEKKTRILYGAMVKAFNVKMRTNIYIPNYVGIGRFSKYSSGIIKLKDIIEFPNK